MNSTITSPVSAKIVLEHMQLNKTLSTKGAAASFQNTLLEGAKAPGMTTPEPSTLEALREKAEELESIFISTMLDPLFSEDEKGFLFGGGQGGDIYRQWMLDEYGKVVTASGGIGLADDLVKSLISLQEV